MHIPDGFIDAPTSIGAGALAASGVALVLRRAGDELVEARAPLAGLVAAFVFAAQMLNFPVAAGTSGHLIGGVLAAILVGPWLAVLSLTVVVVVQSLLFADGGVSALGLNLFNIALVPALVGYALFWLVRQALPTSRAAILAATAVAAFASVVLAALGFTFEYAIGGNDAASLGAVAAAMLGIHSLIGIGEALITTFVVGAVLTSRPDLVHGAGRYHRSAVVPAPAAT